MLIFESLFLYFPITVQFLKSDTLPLFVPIVPMFRKFKKKLTIYEKDWMNKLEYTSFQEHQLEYAVLNILQDVGADDYIPIFARHRITIESMVQLTDEELQHVRSNSAFARHRTAISTAPTNGWHLEAVDQCIYWQIGHYNHL